MKRLLPLLALGCAGLLHVGSPGYRECQAYDDAYLVWHSICLGSSGAAGATGAGGVLTATLADVPWADITLSATSAGFGILGTIACSLANEYAERTSACRARASALEHADGGPP